MQRAPLTHVMMSLCRRAKVLLWKGVQVVKVMATLGQLRDLGQSA
jgi:hypothetical protein